MNFFKLIEISIATNCSSFQRNLFWRVFKLLFTLFAIVFILKNINGSNEKQMIVKICKKLPKELLGEFKIKNPPEKFNAFVVNNNLNESFLNNLKQGGSWKPSDCQATSRIAMVIPYRDRLHNLNSWLYNMHPFLQRQEVEYTIFVVEQAYNLTFNKGILMNAAFREIMLGNMSNKFDCIFYHDVDMIPTNDHTLYRCPKRRPLHYSILVDNHDYRREYPMLVGGALVFLPENFIKVNGYSNSYWGWGAEDDDMFFRLRKKTNLGFDRPRPVKYIMLTHQKRWKNPNRVKILKKDRELQEGFKSNGLHNVNYTLVSIIEYRMHTHLMIDVGIPPPELI